MISINDDSEFTITIADLIKTLSLVEEFTLLIWVNASEIPFEFSDADDFWFLQESLKIVSNNNVEYIFYDIITGVRIVYYDDNERMAIGYC